MIITITSPDRLSVDEPEELTRLAVDATGSSTSEVSRCLARAEAGELRSGRHAWLRIDFLRRGAGALGTDPTWAAGFGDMIAYARSRAWVSRDGRLVRAHVENLCAPTAPEASSSSTTEGDPS